MKKLTKQAAVSRGSAFLLWAYWMTNEAVVNGPPGWLS